MRKRSAIVAISLFLILVVASCGYKPTLKLKQGATYMVEVTTDQKVTQTIFGVKQDMNQNLSMVYAFDVEEIRPNKHALVKVTYHSIYVKHQGLDGTYEYDSKNPPAFVPPALTGYASLMNRSFQIVLQPNGMVSEIMGIDEMIRGLLDEMQVPAGPGREVLEDSLEEEFGSQAMKEMIGQMMAIYPEQPVKQGGSWTRTIVVNQGFPMTLENTWTLKHREGGVSTIEISSIITPAPSAEPLKVGETSISYSDVSGSQTGTMQMDESTGLVVKSNMNQTFFGNIHIEQAGQKFSWPITIESGMTFRMTEKNRSDTTRE